MDKSTHVYVGTYTRHGRSEGIYVFRLEMATGALNHVSTVADVPDPSWLALGPDGRMLYAVNELAEEGGVSAFALDSAGDRLSLHNRVASHGAHPAHLSVDPTGRWVLVANYTGGTIASLPIQPNGALGEAADVVHHAGSGPTQVRQEGPHPHMIVSDPNGRFVLVPDLGLDAVLAYRLDGASGRLVAQPDAGGRVQPGAGPRHLAFGAGGRHVYVINELHSTLGVFAYDAESGHMQLVQTVSTLPDNYSGESTTAAVVVAPSGRFVYGSNRGHDSVAAFAVDQGSGQLTLLGHTPTGGRTPRDVNLDPTGTFLFAANQNSDSITTFRVDARTGALEPTGHVAQAPSPVRVLFGPASAG